ncbi:5'-3' exoribonuclease 1 [Actinomortierella wolfii]|nr:5'-3' exoribonuclease 1 [Actinomortierella wolfii]
MSEDKIFLGIFNYIDHLFMKIKPKKIFFLAIDGVAPRAKMNQQRSRRFRTAKDAADAIKKAIERGEELPEEEPFDRNCITPGTPFMKRLSEQLKYFISKKVTEDANWQNIKIVLSGHEVPGEGEHKIMEYIRLSKAQPDYNPNTRHCLYGLDADLIMLGLLSHEPHFALLREEVTFGRSSKKKVSVDSQNFFLMHLSLLREYLDLEFGSVRDKLPFPYDLERIIDDFVLICLFVGNDFLPHLPNLHIAEGALSLMFNIYKKLLPEMGGYFQDSGVLNAERVERMFHELADKVEQDAFEAECEDLRYLGDKMAELHTGSNGRSNRNQQTRMGKQMDPKGSELVLTQTQKDLYDQIKEFVLARQEVLYFPENTRSGCRNFIKKVAMDIGVLYGLEPTETGKKKPFIMFDEDEDEEDVEAQEARARVLRNYDAAKVVPDVPEDDATRQQQAKDLYQSRLVQWKKDYYKNKMEIDTEEGVRQMVFKYVEGLQWVLFYYYRGVASWGWFYPYHYAPKISDLVNIGEFKLPFTLGEPFRPYEQLMGVLPEASKQHIPKAYWDLITMKTSPIADFYPEDFELDMNGKKQDWEAIVKIPFIDQDRLLEAMKTKEHLLTPEEVERNRFGESTVFSRDESLDFDYQSPLPDFPDIKSCKCKVEVFHLPTIEGVSSLRKGLCEGALTGANQLFGFPSMHTIPHAGALALHGVNVFQQESKNETMVVHLSPPTANESIHPETLAKSKIGKRVYVGWPFLKEGIIVSISDDMFKYELQTHGRNKVLVKTPHRHGPEIFRRQADRLEHIYSKRFGTLIGHVDFTVQVLLLKGMRRTPNGALVKDFLKPGQEQDFALQTLVDKVAHDDPRTREEPARPLPVDFPLRTPVYFLGGYYGAPAQVVAHSDHALAIELLVSTEKGEPDFGRRIAKESIRRLNYQPSFVVSKMLGMSALILSKISSSLHVVYRSTDRRVNLGLNLKFDGKQQKVLGYTRKTETGWEYSEKAVALLREYKTLFPEFIEGLEKRARSDFYIAEDMYGPASADKIKKIEEWLKKSKVKEFQREDLAAEQLDTDAIMLIEQEADKIVNNRPKMKHVILKNLARQSLLKPGHAAQLLNDQTFKLGDRVVFVQDSGAVPIGAKGTVVGIDRLEIEVVFDEKFMSGMDLSGRCSAYRGMTVPSNSILNLSYPQCTPSVIEAKEAKHSSSAKQKTPAAPRYSSAIDPDDLRLIQPDDGRPRGWEVMGGLPVNPDQKQSKKGPMSILKPAKTQQHQRPPQAHGASSAANGQSVRPQVGKGQPLQPAGPSAAAGAHTNKSIGFQPRPRPAPAVPPTPATSEQPADTTATPSADGKEMGAFLLNLLQQGPNNAPPGPMPPHPGPPHFRPHPGMPPVMGHPPHPHPYPPPHFPPFFRPGHPHPPPVFPPHGGPPFMVPPPPMHAPQPGTAQAALLEQLKNNLNLGAPGQQQQQQQKEASPSSSSSAPAVATPASTNAAAVTANAGTSDAAVSSAPVQQQQPQPTGGEGKGSHHRSANGRGRGGRGGQHHGQSQGAHGQTSKPNQQQTPRPQQQAGQQGGQQSQRGRGGRGRGGRGGGGVGRGGDHKAKKGSSASGGEAPSAAGSGAAASKQASASSPASAQQGSTAAASTPAAQ